jgi:hypothetical protein
MAGQTSAIMTGARALIYVGGKAIGFFSSCDWAYQVRVEPAYILGRYSVAELTYVDAEPVTVRCAGFRALSTNQTTGNNGPHQAVQGGSLVPTLAELINAPTVDIEIYDRANPNKLIMRVVDAKAQDYTTSLRAREQETISISFIGKRVSAEFNENNSEGANAATFPGA